MALGNFDGVHPGHQQVIRPVLSVPSEQPLCPTVVTFYPHPREFFTGRACQWLTPITEKAAFLKSLGIRQLVLLPFNQALANLTPAEFVQAILVERLQARQISVGQDFHFGRQRSGTVAELEAIAAQHQIRVHVAPLQLLDGERVSSSAIRQALAEGQIAQATRLLGRPYTLIGPVISGQQLGRTLGFPTANLQIPPEKLLPRFGVYAVQVHSDAWNEGKWEPGVMNIGVRPTVDGLQLTTEVHLLDWAGDLYGQGLTVELLHSLRSEEKFASLEALKAQIQRDCDRARSLLSLPRAVPHPPS